MKRIAAGLSRLPRLGLAWLVLLVALGAPAPESAWAETLKQALTKAYQSNPDLKSAWYQLRGANERRPQALAAWLPNLSLVGTASRSANRHTYDPPYTSSTYNGRSRSGSLQVDQPITSGGAEFARLDQAEQLINQQRALLSDTEQQLLLNTVDAYTNVLATRRIVDYRRRNLQTLRRILTVAQRQLALADRTLSDVALTQSRVLQAEASLVEAESQAAQAVNFYVRMVGEAPGTLEPASPFKPLPTDPQEIEDTARRFGPSVLAAVYAEQAAQANTTAQRRGMLPLVSLQAQVQYQRDADDSDQFVQARGVTATKSIQLQIKIPLYQSGAEYSRIREAKASASQRLVELDSARITAVRQALDVLKQYQAAEQSITLLEAQLGAIKVAVNNIEQETIAGFRTITDLLNTEQDGINALVNLESNRRNKVFYSYKLLSYIGGLTARSLELPVDYYDVEGDYAHIKWKLFGFGSD